MDCIHSFYSFILCIQCQYLCMWVVYKLGSGVNLYLTNEFYNIIIMIATKDIFPIILYYYSIQSSCQHTNAMSTQWHRQPLLFFLWESTLRMKEIWKKLLGTNSKKICCYCYYQCWWMTTIHKCVMEYLFDSKDSMVPVWHHTLE